MSRSQLTLFADVLQEVEKFPGWMQENELRWIHEAAASLQPNQFWVELGVHTGRSALCTILSLPPWAVFVGVDICLGSHVGFSTFIDRATYLRPDIKLMLMKMSSKEACKLFQSESVHSVFIDANHTYESVMEDITLWKNRLVPSGILAGHDYIPEFPGVVRAVNTFATPVVHGYSIWEIKNPKNR